MKCGWRSQQCITPKKAIQPILGNRKKESRPQALATKKNMPLKNLLQEGHLSPSKDLSPASASFPCSSRRTAKLFMEVSVSG